MSTFRVNTNVSALNALRNLGQTNVEFNRSITALSTGLRINSAADDPAGLIASESFRAQIAGVKQAIRNSQAALNYAKTAEGAIDEVNSLLKEARTLALASANTGILSGPQLQANQTQIDLIMESIDRISSQTQFGKKKLLDGSSGVNAHVVNATALESIYLSGTIGTQSITADGAVTVDVTTAATKAAITGTNTTAAASSTAYLAAALGASASFAINGSTFTFAATDTWGDVISAINSRSGSTGVVAEAVDTGGGNFAVQLTQTEYGANSEINLVDSSATILNAAGSSSAAGVNAVADITVGSLTAVTFTAGQGGNNGLTLTDDNGNRVVLTETGNAVATYTSAAQAIVGTAQFQVGGNVGQTVNLSIGNFASAAFSLDNLDVTSSSGANAAIEAIDEAIEEISRRRGEIGSFMRNTLESNIRSLGLAMENLSATESSIRDTDIAEEMTRFTKLQILQQTGLSVLAQANAAPQSVLALLQG